MDSPINGLNEIGDNEVITVRFRDPSYPEDFSFPAKRLPKAMDPPNVLGPDDKEGKDNYRPQIGFQRNFPQASVGAAGHRMVNAHSGGGRQGQGGNYASIGPPNSYNGN